MYEVYKSLKGKKHYLVFKSKFVSQDNVTAATRYFRCSEKNIYIQEGWILNDELYFENPHKKGSKKVYAISHWRKA